jgi:hypothetical protein
MITTLAAQHSPANHLLPIRLEGRHLAGHSLQSTGAIEFSSFKLALIS